MDQPAVGFYLDPAERSPQHYPGQRIFAVPYRTVLFLLSIVVLNVFNVVLSAEAPSP